MNDTSNTRQFPVTFNSGEVTRICNALVRHYKSGNMNMFFGSLESNSTNRYLIKKVNKVPSTR